MNLLNRYKLPAIAGILLVVGFISSCEQDLTSIGEGVIGGEPFTTNKKTYDVFAFNKKIEAVQTNQLPIYQLGVFNDPVYGVTNASLTTQLRLSSANPTFGTYSQATEDTTPVEDNEAVIQENEKVTSVYLHIPYMQNSDSDSDLDGVPDIFEPGDEDDATNDSDEDGLSNSEESSLGTDPLNPDTDGDGILDGDDDSTVTGQFADRIDLDSIYGNIDEPFTFKVERSTYYLRDLDPNTNFQDAQEYFSNQEFSPTFVSDLYFEGEVTVDDSEILFIVEEDDPDTEDVDEAGTVDSELTLQPGIRVELNDTAKQFFQENFLDKEGDVELLSQANFDDFMRGLHLSISSDDDIYFLLNLSLATLTVNYEYDDYDTTEGVTEISESSYVFSLSGTSGGNAVNTLTSEAYPTDILDAMDSPDNASRIYLKGGAGSYAEIQLFESEADIDEIKANNWIINEANLVFHIDTDILPVNAYEPPRLYLYNAETNQPIYNEFTENSLEDTSLGVYLNYDGLLEEDGGRGVRYTIKITEYINNIIVRDSANATLGLAVTADIRLIGANNAIIPGNIEKELPVASILSPLGTVLFGSDLPEEDANKLMLEISYTETN